MEQGRGGNLETNFEFGPLLVTALSWRSGRIKQRGHGVVLLITYGAYCAGSSPI